MVGGAVSRVACHIHARGSVMPHLCRNRLGQRDRFGVATPSWHTCSLKCWECGLQALTAEL
jgi:hypothetical protein